MKFSNIVSESEFARIRELAPATLGAAPGAMPAPTGAPTVNPAVAATGDPQAQAKMQAQQVIDRANQKKQLQDQIVQTQKQLQDLQKQLAQIR
jgi:hypothetical protein